MDIYTSENEQLEQLRQLWKKYGVSTIIGIVVALVISFGWRYWLELREREFVEASVHYEDVLNAIASHDGTGFLKQSTFLMDKYPNTTYAKLTALLVADLSARERRYSIATEKLNWVVRTADNDALRSIAAIRLARLQLAEHKAQDALDTLKKVKNTAYRALAEEVRGDAYVSLQQTKNAREAYIAALTLLPALRTERPVIEMKLNNL